jgi:hypothetical protein
MANLKYKGLAKVTRRLLTPKDFESLGLPQVTEGLEFVGQEVKELPDDVAKTLATKMPKEFALVAVSPVEGEITDDDIAQAEELLAAMKSAKAEQAQSDEAPDTAASTDGEPQSEEALEARDAGSPPASGASASGDASTSPETSGSTKGAKGTPKT